MDCHNNKPPPPPALLSPCHMNTAAKVRFFLGLDDSTLPQKKLILEIGIKQPNDSEWDHAFDTTMMAHIFAAMMHLH
jgi:hypothetical protein